MKKLLAVPAVLMASMLGMTAFAAPEIRGDVIFDAEYYAASYPDVVAIYGTKPDSLFEHYQTYGRSENRKTYDEEALAALLAGIGGAPGAGEAAAPQETAPKYKFTFLKGAPQTEAAWLAELINHGRINNPTDKYIWGYPFEWNQELADAAQLKAEEHVELVTSGKAAATDASIGGWRAKVPGELYNNLVEIIVDGKGSPEEIVGYWTAYQEPRRHKLDNGETVVEPGRYIHPDADHNKIFSHNSRYIGVGHVHSNQYPMGNYWVVFLSQ